MAITIIQHASLGCYDLCHPDVKSETYTLCFDTNDRDNKTVTFCYNEEDAPCIDGARWMLPSDLLDALTWVESQRYMYSSSYNHVGEKTHDERLAMARDLAEINMHDDLVVAIERKRDRRDKLTLAINKMELQIEELEDNPNG